jgi:hypothetical protein
MLRDVNQEPLAFCIRCCTCKKHKIDIKGRQSGVPCFLYTVLHVFKIDVKGRQSGAPCFYTCWFAIRACDRKWAPCVNQEHLLLIGRSLGDRPNAQKCSSPYAVRRVTLWKLIDHCLTRSLNLKRITLESRYICMSEGSTIAVWPDCWT